MTRASGPTRMRESRWGTGACPSSTSPRAAGSRWCPPAAPSSSPTTGRSITSPSCARSWKRAAHRSGEIPTPRYFWRRARRGASSGRSGVASACSPSRCGIAARAGCISPAIVSESSRCTGPAPRGACCSHPSPSVSARTRTGGPPSIARRSPSTCATATSTLRAASTGRRSRSGRGTSSLSTREAKCTSTATGTPARWRATVCNVGRSSMTRRRWSPSTRCSATRWGGAWWPTCRSARSFRGASTAPPWWR